DGERVSPARARARMPPAPTRERAKVSERGQTAPARDDLEVSVGSACLTTGIVGPRLPAGKRIETGPASWLPHNARDVDRRARGRSISGSRCARRWRAPDGESHLSRMSPERPVERMREGLEVDRLHQVPVEAGLPSPHDVVVATERRDGD